MTTGTGRLLLADQWRPITPEVWRERWHFFLGDDRPDPKAVARLLVGGVYQPDTFTVAERFDQPGWLEPAERDGQRWLRDLVAARVAGLSDLPEAAAAHVHEQTRRLLELRRGGELVAEGVYNQEARYLVDRVAAWCLLANPDEQVDQFAAFNATGHAVVADLLGRFGAELACMDTAMLLRVATAAGLVGLDLKGGTVRCAPIGLRSWTPGEPTRSVWARLIDHAHRPIAVEDTGKLLAAVGTRRVRLVWWLDDLIETAFDLLVIGRLATSNRRLEVVVVPKNGRYDNDASTGDVLRLLDQPSLSQLRTAIAAGRVTISRYGPRMATANPRRLHPTLVRAITQADVMVCKGGRVHEMFTGNLARPMLTAYVLVREFTAAQAGYDPANAPLLVLGAEAGEWPWWGFRGRATPRPLPDGRRVSACHSTIAEHRHRTTAHDVDRLATDLARLVDLWPAVQGRYATAARAEIALVRQRLAGHATTPTTHHRQLFAAADALSGGRP